VGIFTGIKIIDLTRVFSGPLATRHFADLGAEVIKIEPPGGDDSRQFPPVIKNWSGYYEVLNRGKKSLTLNLKNPLDLQKLYDLSRDAHVFVENYAPGTTTRLKIDYPTISELNPKIIYASISGVSQNITQKYYDLIAQAQSGLISLNGRNEDMKNATSIVDAYSGVKLAFAISSGLYHQKNTSLGCQIDVSMKGSAFDLLEQNLIAASISGQNPSKVGNQDNAIAPFGIYPTADKNIALAIGSQSQWLEFAKYLRQISPKINLAKFSTNQKRLENLSLLYKTISKIFTKYTSIKIVSDLANLGIPASPIYTMTNVLSDSQNYSEGLLQKINHPVAGSIVVPSGGIKITPQVQFLPYSDKYIDSTVDLLNLCFPQKNITPPTFKWKHFHNFFDNQSVAYLAIDRNQAVCFVCFTPLYINSPKPILFYSCAVQATHPNYRRQGLVRQLTQIIENQLGSNANYLGFSNQSGVEIDRHSKTINYQIIGQLSRQYVPCLPSKTNLTVDFVDSIPIYFTSNKYFSIQKTYDYLNWRYFSNSKNKYHYLKISHGSSTAAYVIISLRKYRVEIVDIIFNPSKTSLSKIVHSVINYFFYQRKLFCTFTYLPNIIWRDVFPVISYTKKLGIYLTVKSENKKYSDAFRWLIQAGDIQ